MDFEEVIKDNELEEVSSIELISIMNKVIEVLKERIDDTEEDDFDIELDEMETDELCELATAVMMVILERVDEDAEKDNDNDSEKEDIEGEEISDKEEDEDEDEELEEVDESYITEASMANAFARKLFSAGDDVIVLANKSDIAKGLKKVPRELRKLPEFELLKTYTTSRKGFPSDKIDDLMNSPLKQYFETYGNNRVRNGTLKTMTSGSTTIPTATKKGTKATGKGSAKKKQTKTKSLSKNTELTTKKKDDAPIKQKEKPNKTTTKQDIETKNSAKAEKTTKPSGDTSKPIDHDRMVNIDDYDPTQVDKPIKKEAVQDISPSTLKNETTKMLQSDPSCIAISSKFGARSAKTFAVIKYLLKIGVPVAAIGGGAMYVKNLLDNSSSTLDISDTTPTVLTQDIPSNKDKPTIETPEQQPKNNDELIITPDMISDDPSLFNNYSDRDNKKPKRIKYAGLGELFNNIGSFVDDSGTSVGSGIGKTIGGFGK